MELANRHLCAQHFAKIRKKLSPADIFHVMHVLVDSAVK